MKLGICSMWGQSLDAFRDEVRLASDLGFDLVTVGDSPAGWHELYVSLTLAALEAPRATLAPLVTSPFMRHPLVTAAALGSIDDLSGGRVALGLATGGSTVLAIGRPPATQVEIRAEFDALRGLFAGQAVESGGAQVKPPRFTRPIPIYYSAFGPKALALAGERADGVILFAGERHLDGLRERIATVRQAAAAAGRDGDGIDVWVVSFASIRDSRAEAIEDLKSFIVVNGMAMRTPEAMARIPSQFRGKIEELHARYDPTEHVVVGGRNVALMEELGLTEYLAEFDTFAGPVESATTMLRDLEAMGVSTFIAALPGHAAPQETIRGLAKARSAM
ncbi:LLM class flavin-dependent oxidoreductase [Novosphingobium sp. BL-52-GroH]|uniref:LLM class flavin-dependent oxidoreductase n=1 Tax=Novosphingobium sp. BL-52-GroH TaxID=3349877 RepID=UPI00384D491A